MSVTKDMSIIKDIMIALEFKAIDYYKISGKWPFWYDDAMAWLREQYEQTSPVLSNSCKTGKDEKDERIRKELIEHIKSNCKTGFLLFQKFSPDDILAWLEKQGEKKPFISNDALREGIAHFGITQYQIDNWLKKYVDVEKQGEKKSSDKVEPKFHEGDWIIYRDEGCTEILRISSVTDTHYICIDISDDYCRNLNINFIDSHNYRLWSINDAKDGDVLLSKHNQPFIYNGIFDEENVGAYCGIDKSGNYFLKSKFSCEWSYKEGVKPATKEQCALLFSKMHEAEYKWDAENKQLLPLKAEPTREIKGNDGKISTKWTEGDEQYLLVCKNALYKYQASDKWDADIISKWLEDKLKQRKQKPKWTDEDEVNWSGIIDEIEANKSEAPDYDFETYDRFLSWLYKIKQRL